MEKEIYEKPALEVVQIELESAVLAASVGENGAGPASSYGSGTGMF